MAPPRDALRSVSANQGLTRVCLAWLLFVISEYAVWIAMLVYAYDRGGAATAGIVAVAQLVPAAAVGPVLATAADRHSPAVLLVGGYAAQALGMAATGAVLLSHGPPPAAYGGAVFASTAITATRPAQAALLPALARSADELTAANAVIGWLESVGIVLAGLLTGLALRGGQPGWVFTVGAVLAAVAGCASLSLRAAAPAAMALRAVEDADAPGVLVSVTQGVAALRQRREPRLMVGLVAAEYVVVGALDVLFVALALTVLGGGPAWAGYLNTAYGVGGVAAGAVTLALLGRRLGPPIMLAAACVWVGLSLTAFSHSGALTLALLGVVGVGRAVLDTATRTLLQRAVPSDVRGRVFGVLEGLTMAGLAIGSLLAPALTRVAGTRGALLGTAALMPAVVAAGWRAIRSLDAAARVPVVEIALLRSMEHFRALPTPELEGLAQLARRRACADGEIIIRQGDPGDEFFAIAEGAVDVRVDGRHVATRRRPEGLGEIALLRQTSRSATVVAQGPVVLYALNGQAFLAVVTGHEATWKRAEAVAESRLKAPDDRGPDRGGSV